MGMLYDLTVGILPDLIIDDIHADQPTPETKESDNDAVREEVEAAMKC